MMAVAYAADDLTVAEGKKKTYYGSYGSYGGYGSSYGGYGSSGYGSYGLDRIPRLD